MVMREVPEGLTKFFETFKDRMLKVHGMTIDARLYMMMVNWMALFDRPKSPDDRSIMNAQYLKTLDQTQALWAIRLKTAHGDKFFPVIGHRILKAPIDAAPMTAFARYGRHLHYTTQIGHEKFVKTKESMLKNYDLGPIPFNFQTYTAMCEICRTGRSEPLKYHVQDATVHRLRLQLGNVSFPRTFYVIWSSDLQLIVGTMGRGIAESLKSA